MVINRILATLVDRTDVSGKVLMHLYYATSAISSNQPTTHHESQNLVDPAVSSEGAGSPQPDLPRRTSGSILVSLMPGQIIQRGRNIWLVRIYHGSDVSGKRAYENKTIHGNKKDAEIFLNEALRRRDLGGTEVAAQRTMVSELLEDLRAIALGGAVHLVHAFDTGYL